MPGPFSYHFHASYGNMTIQPEPLDVVRWARRNGGELMGLPVGQVKEGFLADMLVVEGDPSADVSVLQDRSRIRAILKGGRFVKDTL